MLRNDHDRPASIDEDMTCCNFVRWMEVLGCGMVDPRVLEKAGVDPEEYTGFAAGFGVERFAMVLFGVPDLRLFWDSDMRFLDQFPADIQASGWESTVDYMANSRHDR